MSALIPQISSNLPDDRAPAYLDAVDRLKEFSQRADGAYSPNTFRAWVSDCKVFWQFCEANGLKGLPADGNTVCQFIDDYGSLYTAGGQKLKLGDTPSGEFFAKRSLATIKRYIASISVVHRAADLPDPTKTHYVELALRTVKRLHAAFRKSTQAQAAPLHLSTLETGFSALKDRPIDHFTRALVSLAYDCLCRPEDLPRLDIDDIGFESDGSGVLYIGRSKTDPFGEGKHLYISKTTMCYLSTWLGIAGIRSGPLFRAVNNAGNVGEGRVSYMAVNRAMKRVAKAAGIEERGVSGHSCRVGAAQDLLSHGFGLAEIMQAGRWTSERMPARYTEKIAASRGGMAKYCENLAR